LDQVKDIKELRREEQILKSIDILAIKGLAQFERFPAVVALGNLIENWHISDFHISKARPEQEAGYAEHLSREGENLSLVIQYLYNHHRDRFEKILQLLKMRIPGISHVDSKTTEEGRVLLKFQDGSFEDPFLARYVSDGTIKMLAYLTLLYDPLPIHYSA
jgi:predicted ATPase